MRGRPPAENLREWKAFKQKWRMTFGDRWPSDSELRAKGNVPLLKAMQRHHGGAKTVRSRVGNSDLSRLREWKNLKRELRKRFGKRFPKERELRAPGLSKIRHAILHHGGSELVKQRLRQEGSAEQAAGQLVEELLQRYSGHPLHSEVLRASKDAAFSALQNRKSAARAAREAARQAVSSMIQEKYDLNEEEIARLAKKAV